jgi:D-alanyl-D-alanine carboxypeptidase
MLKCSEETGIVPDRLRDHLYLFAVHGLGMLLLPIAFVVKPRRARHTACRWAMALRFPSEDLTGLTPATQQAFHTARAEAFWRDGRLIGITSGHRDAGEQERLFASEVARTGSPEAARILVLPPDESRHVAGTAIDVRPATGARWLEQHGGRHNFYRVYDNEWWHFEYHPDGPPERLPSPAASPLRRPA